MHAMKFNYKTTQDQNQQRERKNMITDAISCVLKIEVNLIPDNGHIKTASR